ncbi:signal peptidase I [Thermoflavimicrobium dichotomicum]|uniref:Signal peptidase I n=1 Tax=Thermoflavimicrobium dichotomicum TaxID=46223 RepID=A0A1I3MVP5_9BACL|nr:signal peptidase I [Thermoflavimicrobium dichotomicum]SFJ01041.1 signal peptidase I [Thermoflavimicrobium dichotomicum]
MNWVKNTFSWLVSIATGVIVALLISIFVFQPTEVVGSSMEPTLKPNHRIYISKLPHTFKYEPEYGDIVIIDSRVDRPRTFKDDLRDNFFFHLFSEGEDHIIWVKRVIGKPGDVLEFKNNKVYRNGQPLDEPYIKEEMNYTSDEKIVVPEGHIFVMGDNRNNSRDSREIGPVPIDHVLGKMIF